MVKLWHIYTYGEENKQNNDKLNKTSDDNLTFNDPAYINFKSGSNYKKLAIGSFGSFTQINTVMPLEGGTIATREYVTGNTFSNMYNPVVTWHSGHNGNYTKLHIKMLFAANAALSCILMTRYTLFYIQCGFNGSSMTGAFQYVNKISPSGSSETLTTSQTQVSTMVAFTFTSNQSWNVFTVIGSGNADFKNNSSSALVNFAVG